VQGGIDGQYRQSLRNEPPGHSVDFGKIPQAVITPSIPENKQHGLSHKICTAKSGIGSPTSEHHAGKAIIVSSQSATHGIFAIDLISTSSEPRLSSLDQIILRKPQHQQA